MDVPDDRRAAESTLNRQIQRSLTVCWKEGIASQVMVGIIDCYLIPLALFLGASDAAIGLLVAVPNLLASISQFFAVGAVRAAGDRLRFLVIGVFLQALFLLPVAGLAVARVPHRVAWLIALVAVHRVISNLLGPAWGSLVSEYLPPQRRGHYFGWRSRILGITGLINIGVWGVFLSVWKRWAAESLAFGLLFAAAAVARLCSFGYMSRMLNLPFTESKETEFTFWMFLRRFRESNFVKFVFFVAGITFATNLSAPYFSVYMLRDLHFDYVPYMAVTLASVVSGLLSFPMWGRHADLVGNARILKTTALFIPMIPLLWMFPHTAPPLVVIELLSGFVWGGFNLCVTNFIYDAVVPAKRVRCLGYFNLINGTAVFAGATLGGYLATRLPAVNSHSILALFAVSAAGRLLAGLFLSRHFREVRERTQPASSTQLFFSVVGVRPIAGRAADFEPIPSRSDIDFARRGPETADNGERSG